MVTFLLSVHTIIEAKQYAGRSQGGGSSSFDLAHPGVAPPLHIQGQTSRYSCAVSSTLVERKMKLEVANYVSSDQLKFCQWF